MLLIAAAWAIDVPDTSSLRVACDAAQDGDTIRITADLTDNDECTLTTRVHITTDGGTYAVDRIFYMTGSEGSTLTQVVIGRWPDSQITVEGGAVEATDLVFEGDGEANLVWMDGGTLSIDGFTASGLHDPLIYAEPNSANIDITLQNGTVTNAVAGVVKAANFSTDELSIVTRLSDVDVSDVSQAAGGESGMVVNAYLGEQRFEIQGGTFENLDTGALKLGAGTDGESITAEIVGTRFEDNASETGGAIEADQYTDLSVISSTFVGNSATAGGAIYALGPASISDSRFCANTALGQAAHLFLVNDTLSVKYTVFQFGLGLTGIRSVGDGQSWVNNSFVAHNEGAMLEASGGTITLTNNLFFENTQAADIGAASEGSGWNAWIANDANGNGLDALFAAGNDYLDWTDPGFESDPAENCEWWPSLAEDSVLIDAGDPASTDPAGGPADIGAMPFIEPVDTGDSGDSAVTETGETGDSDTGETDMPDSGTPEGPVRVDWLGGGCSGCRGGAAALLPLLLLSPLLRRPRPGLPRSSDGCR